MTGMLMWLHGLRNYVCVYYSSKVSLKFHFKKSFILKKVSLKVFPKSLKTILVLGKIKM